MEKNRKTKDEYCVKWFYGATKQKNRIYHTQNSAMADGSTEALKLDWDLGLGLGLDRLKVKVKIAAAAQMDLRVANFN